MSSVHYMSSLSDLRNPGNRRIQGTEGTTTAGIPITMQALGAGKVGFLTGRSTSAPFSVCRKHTVYPVKLWTITRPPLRARPTVRATTTGLSAKFAIEGIDVVEGTGGLPLVKLHKRDKSEEAEIYLHGGVITSWKSKGKELLHVRPDAVFNGVKPISGGIPHCFPQFGPGPLQQHGFARNVSWSVAASSNENDSPSVTLELRDSEYSQAMWEYKFLIRYTVVLEAAKLKTELVIKNVDRKPFSFTTALHTYFSAKIGDAVITGLNGLRALDKHPVTKEFVETAETRDMVTFGGFVDRVYLDAPSRLVLRNGHGDTIAIENEGWTDAVVWNPHLTMKLYYKDFVCIENAKVSSVVELQPEESWTAKTTFGV